jgi:hypothetical protein
MDEKWTYLVLSDPDKNPTGLRVTLQDRGTQRQATIQITPAGEQVDLTEELHDYECMEWKARELLDAARGDDSGELVIDAIKHHLRDALGG